MQVVLAAAAVLAIGYLIPIAVYGAASALRLLEVPDQASPQAFLLGVLVTKAGTAFAFVLLLHLTRAAWSGRWWLYALVWFVMFAASEIGDAISRRSSLPEAVLGIISEALYAPASTLAAFAILRVP